MNSFRNLYGLFTRKILHRKVRDFAEALTKDLSLRHQKYEDPNYVLEPNIKEGEGGLRDFQIGRWIIRAKYKTDRWDSILFPDHSQKPRKEPPIPLGRAESTPSPERKKTG